MLFCLPVFLVVVGPFSGHVDKTMLQPCIVGVLRILRKAMVVLNYL